jgi:hypothetical protein
MKFSNTTDKNGILQACEFWTGLGDTGITSDTYLLKVFTYLCNEAMNDILPVVLGKTDELRWDDPQQTTFPIGFADLVIGKSSYPYLTDSAGNSVYNIARIFLRTPSNDTLDWDRELVRVPTGGTGSLEGNQSGVLAGVTTDYSRIINPRFSETGTPHSFAELNGVIFLYPIPDYNNAEGMKILFEREPVRFISSGNTTIGNIPFADVTAGIPDIFQALIPLRASRKWLAVNKPDVPVLMANINSEIATKEAQLNEMQSKRTPTKIRITFPKVSTR